VILREAEPVHIEAGRRLDTRDVKHGAWESVGHGVDALRLPRGVRELATTWHYRTTVGSRVFNLAAGEIERAHFRHGLLVYSLGLGPRLGMIDHLDCNRTPGEAPNRPAGNPRTEGQQYEKQAVYDFMAVSGGTFLFVGIHVRE
jgi:hypothetical protein